jgi:predicted transcriptional regulator
MEQAHMTTVTLGLASTEAPRQRLAAAFNGEAQGAHITFLSPALIWKVLTPKRWDILKAMTGEGELSIREVARRVGRDVKAVHGDVHALLDAGILDRTDRGVMFAFEAVHVDFTLNKAA